MKKTHTSARPKRRLPSLHSLQVFEAVARRGSITAAAQDLHVTHGAVSRQVKALEAYLGEPLLRRSGRGIGLTPAGQLLQPELEAALGRIAQAVERVAERTTRLTLNINVTSSFAARCIIPKLTSFCGKNPAIDVRIGTSDSRLDFDPQECDISIRSLYAREVHTLRRRRDWQSKLCCMRAPYPSHGVSGSTMLGPPGSRQKPVSPLTIFTSHCWQPRAEWGSRWEPALSFRRPSRRARW